MKTLGIVAGVVVALVAVYGAVLSTMTYRAQRARSKAKIDVKLSQGFATFGPRISGLQLQVTAINVGERAVLLSSVGLRLPDGRTIPFMSPTTITVGDLPHVLEPHRDCLVAEDVVPLAHGLVQAGYRGELRLVGFYRDAEDNEHESKPYEINVEDWLSK